MLGSKKKFRPTFLSQPRKLQENNRVSSPRSVAPPATSSTIDYDSIPEPSLLTTTLDCSEIPGTTFHEETDPIFPQNILRFQAESSSPLSSSPLPDLDLDRTSSPGSPHRSLGTSTAGEDFRGSDEETLVAEDGNDPRRKEIGQRLKAAKKRNDFQLIKLLSRPELFDPDRPLDRSKLTMSQLIRISSIKFREPNAGKNRANVRQTQNHLDVQDQEPVDDQPSRQKKVLQVKIVNEKIVLDEESMLLPTARQDTGVRSGDVVYEHGLEGQGFQRRHKRKYKVRRWSDLENKKLLVGLSQFGTDFSIIQATLFPTRTRIEIKNKFKREEKVHPVRINKALAKKIPVMEYVHLEDLENTD